MHALTRERFQQIDAAFAAALELVPSARDDFLARTGRSDPTLAAEVRCLLDCERTSAGVLGDSASGFGAALFSAAQHRGDEAPAVGMRLGPYRVIRELGRGGMGAVYLADRIDDSFRKRVAIKLVKRGMDTDEVLWRFRAERQILASLEHPNIARLYDGGVSDDGRPYLVMEYVDGEALDAYCDRHSLSIERRLKLFQSICTTVLFAHQNLVIHRDLKPSNIFVTADGTIKLLDFGIAKLLGVESTGDDTATGTHAFTPEYASPEQLRGRAVDTATDVYQLGVILQHLLAGRRTTAPDRLDRIHKAHNAASHRPERPSDIARTASDTVLVARGMTQDRLVRRLRGDLDAIVLKAVEYDPASRFSSPRELIDDIQRHLDGDVVVSQRVSRGNRIWRFSRRHRVAVAAAVSVSVLVATFTVFHNSRITRERDLAEQRRDTAEQVVGFLTGMMTAADPNTAQGDTLTVFEALVRSERQLERTLATQPDVREELWRVLGRTYRELGQYESARRLLDRAFVSRRARRGDEDSLVAESGALLAGALLDLGKRDSAERVARRVLDLRRGLYGPAHVLVAASLAQLGELRWNAGDLDQSAELVGRSLAINRRRGAAADAVANSLHLLGSVRRAQARFTDAESLLREALSIRQTAFGNNHPSVPSAMISLGAVLRDQGKQIAAEPMFRTALEVRERVLGADHPDVVEALTGLAFTLHAQHKSIEAVRELRKAIEINRRVRGISHPEVGMLLLALGSMHDERGATVEAERTLRSAVEVMERSLGQRHPTTALAVSALGRLLVMRGRIREGEVFLRRVVDTRKATRGASHYSTLGAQADLGWCLLKAGRLAESESTLLSTHAAWQPRPGVRDSSALRRLRENIVNVSNRLGNRAQAHSFRQLLAMTRTAVEVSDMGKKYRPLLTK